MQVTAIALLLILGRLVVIASDRHDTKSVLITGGAGFIGRYVSHEFCSRGWTVTVVDDLSSDHSLSPVHWPPHLSCPENSLRFIEADCRHYFQSSESYGQWTAFLHLASRSSVDEEAVEYRYNDDAERQLAYSLQVTDNLGIDVAAFHWAADNSLQAKGHTIGGVFLVDDVTSTVTDSAPLSSFFADMITSHSSVINARVIRTGSIFGRGQPARKGVIARLVAAVEARSEDINLPSSHCDGYIYVNDAARSVFKVVAQTTSAGLQRDHEHEHEPGRESKAVVVLRSDRLSLAGDILAEVMAYAPPDYSPGVTFNAAGDGAGVAPPQDLCSAKAALSDRPSSILDASHAEQEPAKSVAEGIRDMFTLLSTDGGGGEHVDSGGGTGATAGGDRDKVYSSVRCTAGHQNFPDDWNFYEKEYNDIGNRVCMFENVCLMEGRLIYFQHESEVNAPSYSKFIRNQIVFLSLTGLLNVQISVAPKQSMPEFLDFVDDKTWLFTLASFSFNFAHLLLDELFSAIAVMDIFDISYDESNLLYYGCAAHHDKVNLYDAENPHKHPYDFEISVPQICENNVKLYSKLVFGREAVELGQFDGKNVCFKKLIMGQGYVLSSRFVDKQRSMTLRKGRDLILKNLGFQHLLPPRTLSIMILPKKAGFYSSAWPDMCTDITSIVRNDLQMTTIPINCVPHDGSRSVQDEILLMQQATLIIAEHGTISFVSLYANDGTVLLSVGTKDKLKDGQTLLYATHLQVLYSAVEELDSMADLVRFGLHRAAVNFNISLDV